MATVTQAEIYAAQGHTARALVVLDEVLASEPDHDEALRIRRELTMGQAAPAEAAPSPKEPVPVGLRAPEPLRAEPSAPPTWPELPQSEPASEFPSTEYVPVQVVETTGHESSESAEPDVGVVIPADTSESAEPWSGPILAAEQHGSSLCLYWELSPEIVSRSGLDESEGSPALAVVAFTPAGPNPLRDQRTLPLTWHEPFSGTLVVSDLGPHAAVRAAVGWLVEGTFLPLAVGRTLARLESESPAAAARAGAALEALLPRT